MDISSSSAPPPYSKVMNAEEESGKDFYLSGTFEDVKIDSVSQSPSQEVHKTSSAPQMNIAQVTRSQQPQPIPTVVTVPNIPGYTGNQQQVVVLSGNCPSCRVGNLFVDWDESAVCGLCCLICFFPLGLLCFFGMTNKRCSHCRNTFSLM